MPGNQVELVQVGGERVEHHVLDTSINPGLYLPLYLINRSWHIDGVDVFPGTFVAGDSREPALLLRSNTKPLW